MTTTTMMTTKKVMKWPEEEGVVATVVWLVW